MIVGPIPPNGRPLDAPLREFVDRLEPGLVVLQDRVGLDGLCTIDILAADADGRAVCCFALEGRSDGQLAAELLEARLWLDAHAALLARVLGGRCPRLDQPPRFLVVGSVWSDRQVALMQSLGIPELEVHELHRLRLGDQDTQAFARRDAGAAKDADCGVGAAAFSVPGGIQGSQQQGLWSEAMAILQRLDPKLQGVGDRHGRLFALPQGKLLELRAAGSALRITVGESPPVLVHSRYELERALDRVVRRYLELKGLERPRQEAGPAELSFAAIERSVRSARVSESEQAALGQAFAAAGTIAGTGPPHD